MKEMLEKQIELLSKCSDIVEPSLLIEISKAMAEIGSTLVAMDLMNSPALKSSEENSEEFKKLCEPVVEWLRENYHPHCKIVIDCTSAELMEEALGTMHSVTD